jgi:4-amino-4-deoxy-L-arabinose transferase-like glycosyltransferase
MASIAMAFVLAGLPFLRQSGMHYDASSELACFYSCSNPVFKIRMFNSWVPLMVIQYLGALKAWLYLPILKYLEVTAFVLRLPLLVAGAGSICLFFAILDRIAGRRTAIAGALLLATDASFLLSTCYDFGPVVLLHLFLLSGIFLLLRFEKTRRSRYLALAFFLFGLALWHKALFIWMLAGLAAASAVIFPKRILALVTPARVLLAVLSFGAGSLPLLYYNAVRAGATLHTEKVMSAPAPLAQKVLLFKKTMDSSVLFGWLTEYAQPETVRAPSRMAGKISVKLNAIAGAPRSNWMLYLFLTACLLVPWLWFTPARLPALFALIYVVAVWGQMAILPNTGGTVHHVILLWPFPHLLIAVALVRVAERFGRYGARVFAAALVAIVCSNAAVINRYYCDLVTHGTTAGWTDAINPLFARLDAAEGQRIVTVDWGYSTTLCLFSDGRMPLRDISFSLLQPSAGAQASIRALMGQPNTLFVDHTADSEVFPGVREHLDRIAAEAGCRKEVVQIIKDRNQRPRFEISRYRECRP